ncbi:MAG: hypothetical protein HOM11_08640 [Methylococcales bacterium]|jgi:hypothetical protein|nr:hypothetical protein [Methylococcales bacterium]MBT7445888.1 hypothetical protein [Methylococcales bacterium]
MMRLLKHLNVSGNASYWWGHLALLAVFLGFQGNIQSADAIADTLIASIGIAIIWDLSYFVLWSRKQKQQRD